MLNEWKLRAIDLRLFDGTAGRTGAEGGEGSGAAEQAVKQGTDGGRRGKKAGVLDGVVYGKQATLPAAGEEIEAGRAAETEVSVTSDTAEARKAEYEQMLEQYKDLDDERLNRIIRRRLKDSKQAEANWQAFTPVLDLLRDKYQVQDGDVAKLVEAINNDDAYWEQAAEEHGMSVEQYRQFQQMERENAQLRALEQRRAGEEQYQRQLDDWWRQGEAVKKIYPRFDLRQEAQNPEFLKMLDSGVPVQHAYEVLHIDDIKTGVASFAAQATEHKVVENIRAKGARPAENGAAGRSGITIKSDVHSLSKQDRKEIARRVARGETITF